MKKIEAIIRVEMLTPVMDALEAIGTPGMTVTRIEGHGRQKGIKEQFRGREFRVNLLPKVKIELVVHDKDLEKIATCIMGIAKTGDVGDGKLFIYPVEDVRRIRTGEKGDVAI